jgi:WD40 repeat protein
MLWKSFGVYSPQSDVSADGQLAVFAGRTYNFDLVLLRNPGPQPEQVRSIKLPGSKDFIRLSAGGERVVVVGNLNRKVDLFDTTTGLPLAPFERADMKRYWSFAWLGTNGQQLVGLVTAKAERGLSGSEEWVVLWDATTGKIVQRVTNPSALGVLVVAPDGRRLAEAGADKMVRIRDTATLAVQQEFRAHDGPITALAWHPAKPILATTSADLTIRLWNLETGRRLEELRGPVTTPMGLGFSPSGQRLACASPSDNTRIWAPDSLNEKPASTPSTDNAWEDLLAPLTPAIVAETGKGWRMDNGALFSPHKSHATLPLPGKLSDTSYTVRVKLRHLVAKNGFSLELPVGTRMVGFDLDGFVGKWTSLNLVNGTLGKDLPGSLEGKQVKDSDQHTLEVTVRLTGSAAVITCTLDDQPLYEWAGPTAALSQHSSWKTAPGALALGTMAADWVVYEVKVKRLDAK